MHSNELALDCSFNLIIVFPSIKGLLEIIFNFLFFNKDNSFLLKVLETKNFELRLSNIGISLPPITEIISSRILTKDSELRTLSSSIISPGIFKLIVFFI